MAVWKQKHTIIRRMERAKINVPKLRPQRAEGPATVLAIGTATPPGFVEQATYPDFYFGVTNSNHMTDLKDKFIRICKGSTIEKRHMHLTEETLMQNPGICTYMAPSLDARQDILAEEVPKLGKEAAMKAIKEWGQPMSKITHLVFYTTSGVDMPGADYKLLKLLGLHPSVKRFMLYQVGCFAGATVLRLAKDLAENNAGARVLAVCSEISAVNFHAPSHKHVDNLVGQAIFGDGAAAVVVGADPLPGIESPVFEMGSASQTIIPGSEGRIEGRLREAGLVFYLLKDVPELIAKNIADCLKEALGPLGEDDWNSIFWVAHPGGRSILDQVEAELGMSPERLRASRKVMREHGNMSSATVLFVMEEVRRRSMEEGAATTGEGLEWGVLLGFGPGLTVETMVLRSVPLSQSATV